MNDDHRLTVEQVPRANYPRRGIPAGTEPCGDGVTTDLTDLRTVPLADIAQAVNDGDTGLDIADPDGWRHADAPAWDEPITLPDFRARAAESTARCVLADGWDRIRRDAAAA